MQFVCDYFTTQEAAGLEAGDRPEKVVKLGRMVALFLREDEGQSVESL